MRGWRFAVAVMLPTLAAEAEAARLTVTASRSEILYAQTAEPDCTDLANRGLPGKPDLPLHVVRLSVEQPVTDGSVRYQWSEPAPAVGVFAADLDLGPDDQTRLIRSFCAELGNACVLTGEALALYDRPTILWVAPTCDVIPKDTTRPYRGDRVRFAVRAFQGKRRVGRGSVEVGYGRLASTTLLVADPPYVSFRDGHGKSDGEKTFLNVAFGAAVDPMGQTLTVTKVNFDPGESGKVSDVPPCDDPDINGTGLIACDDSTLYDTGGKHTAKLQVDLDDGSALCDNLTVNVRVSPHSIELDVSTTPKSSVFIPGDPTRGSPALRVRARNTSPDVIGGGVLFTGNVLSCETEAKVGGTTLTRKTQIDLQHCSATVSQACNDDGDCQTDKCPTCQAGEVCLTSDHCSGPNSFIVGCANDRDCEKPRCPFCDFGETCVKVLPISRIFLAPGDSVDLVDSTVNLINILTSPAKIKETWTSHSFNAGDASDSIRYTIKPRPEVKP